MTNAQEQSDSLDYYRNALLEWAEVDPPKEESGKEALDDLAGILQRFGFDPLKIDIQPVIQYACWDHEDGEFAQAWDTFSAEVLDS